MITKQEIQVVTFT